MNEIDVVKVILLREEYIARAKINLGHCGSKIDRDREALEDLLSLLDLLRSVTLDSVEAIQKWRSKGSTGPFLWKGTNYLLKIPCDTDFLDDCKVGSEPNLPFSLSAHSLNILVYVEKGFVNYSLA